MNFYPAYLDLSRARCLVIGAGSVGVRKIRGLVDGGAKDVLVLDLAPLPDDLKDLADGGSILFFQREFQHDDLDGVLLAMACTSNATVNTQIAGLCRERGILCNVADQPEVGSFIVPATFTQGDLTLAISTGGASPAMAQRIRKDLEATFGPHYGTFLLIMNRLRPMMLALGRPTTDNTKVFRALVASGLLDALKRSEQSEITEILTEILPEDLQSTIPELIDDLC